MPWQAQSRSYFPLVPTRIITLVLLGSVLGYASWTLLLRERHFQGVGEGEYEFVAVYNDPIYRPVFFLEAPDDSDRRFVVSQEGRIYQIENRELVTFLDIRDRVNDGANEQGLLGMAFHPQFAENGYFYLNYTDESNATIIARYSTFPVEAGLADPSSETVILRIPQPFRNHNGGMIAFGPDGYLYIGLGDGGSAGDPRDYAQNLGELLGSVLRIDVDVETPNTKEMVYGIPKDNPFADGLNGRPEIWAYGLRNPWRFSFDMATGDFYIGDVGQGNIEEINFQAADSPSGVNYGWNGYEGSKRFQSPYPENAVFPVAEYTHRFGCSVTGGYVYRGTLIPELDGVYFYADYCSGVIWSLRQDERGEWQSEIFLDTDFTISSFGQDLAGEIYVVDHAGLVYQLLPKAAG